METEVIELRDGRLVVEHSINSYWTRITMMDLPRDRKYDTSSVNHLLSTDEVKTLIEILKRSLGEQP